MHLVGKGGGRRFVVFARAMFCWAEGNFHGWRGREKRERKKKKRLVVSSSRDTYIDELGVVALP